MKFAAKILFATIVLVANHPAFAVRRQKRLGEEQVAQHRRTRYYTNEDGVVTAAGGGKSGKGKSNDSDGKSGKGKSNSDGKSGKGKGRFGGGKSGKNGKSGKSSASDQCVCNGLTQFKYVDFITLIQLALIRLENIAGAEPALMMPPPFTYSLAHSLAPPNCHLAGIDSESDLVRLREIYEMPGWVGVTKDIADAYEDRDYRMTPVRRDGWFNVAGGELLGHTEDFPVWNTGEPTLQLDLTDTRLIEYVAGLDGDLLSAYTVTSTLDGAYYECCAEVLDACFTSGVESLEDVLLPLLQAS